MGHQILKRMGKLYCTMSPSCLFTVCVCVCVRVCVQDGGALDWVPSIRA